MKVVKYILAVLFIFSALGGIFTGDILTGLFFLILGFILLPFISEKLKENIKLWRNKTVRYVAYFVIIIIAGASIDKENINSIENKSKSDEVVTNEKKRSKGINSGVTNFDGNEVSKATNSEQNFNNVVWSSKFSKSEIQGEWLQVLWYNPQNVSEKTYYEDGDEEQKILSLTKNTYQTSTEIGGENPNFNYQLKNDSYYKI